jgi:glycosyltransferase involved in cell wall biosynthesis
MNLLFYTRPFAPSIGGVETYAMLLACGLAKKSGADAVKITLVTESHAAGFDDSALPFTVVRRPGFARLLNLVRHSDVVNVAGPAILPILLAKILRKPVVVEHHGYQSICPNGLLLYGPTHTVCTDRFMRHRYFACARCNVAEAGWLASLKMLFLTAPRRWLCRMASANVTVSRHVEMRVRLPRSLVIYHGVPNVDAPSAANAGPDNVLAPPNLAKVGAPPSKLSVVYLGRLVQEKGVATLLDAARLLKSAGCSFALKIIGDGPLRSQLEAIAAEINARAPCITFTGPLRGDDLRAALRDTDVLVLTTLSEEAGPLAVLESLSRGCPVIVSGHGAAPELAGDAGLAFPPGDAAALAACIRRLVDEPGLLNDLQTKARSRAAAMFTEQRMIDEHLKVFERVAKKK